MELNYIMCSDRLPEEYVPKYGEGTKRSDWVIVWDTFYGPSIDRLWDGEWQSDRKAREGNFVEPAVCHEKICWAEIPFPDCINPNYFKCPRKE